MCGFFLILFLQNTHSFHFGDRYVIISVFVYLMSQRLIFIIINYDFNVNVFFIIRNSKCSFQCCEMSAKVCLSMWSWIFNRYIFYFFCIRYLEGWISAGLSMLRFPPTSLLQRQRRCGPIWSIGSPTCSKYTFLQYFMLLYFFFLYRK